MCLQMPNRYLQATLDNRRKLAEVIRLKQPGLLFGPMSDDYHPDHVETAKLVQAARFEAKFHKTDMAGVPHWVPLRYGYYSTQRDEHGRPSFIVDITDCWDQKTKAIEAYQSQIRNASSASDVSLVDKVEVTCRYFGQCIGSTYGEPFFSYQPIGLSEPGLLADFR
jgi:LmbE family N-acetylglucosaminyl deacetylase